MTDRLQIVVPFPRDIGDDAEMEALARFEWLRQATEKGQPVGEPTIRRVDDGAVIHDADGNPVLKIDEASGLTAWRVAGEVSS